MGLKEELRMEEGSIVSRIHHKIHIQKKIRKYYRSKSSGPETKFNEDGTNKFHITLSSRVLGLTDLLHFLQRHN
jgi:hypothetical protein